MPDDQSDERNSQAGSGATDEWIDRIAESEGLNRDEVVEQLVSSYWTLKEMHGLMEHSEEGMDTEADPLPLDIETLYSETLSEELGEITSRLDRLETELDERGVKAGEIGTRVETLAQRLSSVEEKLGDRQNELQSRFDEEFANLETILDYLIEMTDDLESRLDQVVEEQAAERTHREEQERLVDLKRLASRLGVKSAKCEYCDERIEIALLPTPDCPQCDRRFTDIQPSQRWLGLGTDVLKVTSEPYLDEKGDDHYVGDDTEVSSTDRVVDSFRWGENRD